MNFERERKGYNRAEVDEYVRALKAEYEARLSEQKERIFKLKAELVEREKQLEGSRARAELVSQAIIKAVEKAEEIERLASARYREEMDALKAFHEKWTAHYNKLLARYPDDEGLKATAKFNEAMTDILSGGSAAIREIEAQFDSEAARLRGGNAGEKSGGGAGKKSAAKAAVNDGRSASPDLIKNDTSESGFSFSEAWNPTDDLSSIMHDLGIDPAED